jgi:hypothetical protein
LLYIICNNSYHIEIKKKIANSNKRHDDK